MSQMIRNIGIMAHIDAGKTTTTERILFFTGKSHKIGEVDSGTATMDWMEQEQNRGITITSAATTCTWKNHQINIIDTPGHVDFTAEVERSLRVLDGAVAVFCAVGGVQPQSETVWHQADSYKVPRIAYINKMDRIGANFNNVLEEMKQKFNCVPVPLYFPIGSESEFEGIVDIISAEELIWDAHSEGKVFNRQTLRSGLTSQQEAWFEHLTDTLSSFSDELTELLLAEAVLPPTLLLSLLRQGTIEQRIIPVLCGSSLKNVGVQPLLDAVLNLLPAPDELPEITGTHKSKETAIQLKRQPDEQLAALVFKIQNDKEAGSLAFIRVYSGTLEQGKMVYNVTKGKKERINRILRVHAARTEQVDSLQAGDIGAIVGFKLAQTGDSLGSEGLPVLLESMHFPEPVISIAIEPKTLSDQEKLKTVLDLLSREDPTFMWNDDSDTGQMIIRGMGELHLDVLVTRIRDDFKVGAKTGKPQVSYRESISAESTYREDFHKLISGKEQAVSIEVSVAPAARGSGNSYSYKGPQDLPEKFRDAIQNAIQLSFGSGIQLGYPCVDVSAQVTRVDWSEESISEFACEAAASAAFDSACRNAAPVLLAPVMKVAILTPKEHLGDVASSITMRKGIVMRMESRPAIEVLHAQAPLEELFGYTTALRSMTQGRGSFSMEFSHFEAK